MKKTAKTPPTNRKYWLLPAGIFLLSLSINCIGLGWGQPGGTPWQPDSIAGTRTIQFMPQLFKPWMYKYPRFHFLINAAIYKPFLNHWQKKPVSAQSQEYVNRISLLIVLSQLVSALMGAASVAAVFLTAKLLFSDWLAGLLAALALAFSQEFVFYSHLGNVDVPSVFWFSGALYWAVKAVYIGKWRHFALLGLFASLAVCTKDPTAGCALGLGLGTCLAMIGKELASNQSFKKALISIFDAKVVVAVLIAAFCFALLNDLLTTPDAFFKRMSHWETGGRGVAGYAEFDSQLPLLWKSCKNLYYLIGWPLLAATTLAAIYCGCKFPSKTAFALLPLIVFYLVIITKIKFSYSRFFIPTLPALFLVTGKACADFLRWPKLPAVIKFTPIAIVYILSALYTAGLDLELVTDSRYRAEKWLTQNVSSGENVTAISGLSYAPRLHMLGLPYSYRWDDPVTANVLLQPPVFPDYVVMCEKAYDRESFDKKFLNGLFDGSIGYKTVAEFTNQYLYPKKTIFAIAGRPMKLQSLISPRIVILKRQFNKPEYNR